MVTTRHGHDTSSPAVAVPPKQARNKRVRGEVEEATPAKKRKSAEEKYSSSVTSDNLLSQENINGMADFLTSLGADAGSEAEASLESRKKVDRSQTTPKSNKSTPVKRNTAEKPKKADDFDGDVINVAPTNGSADAPKSTRAAESEDDSFYGTPATHATESVYATPATHLKTPGTNLKAAVSSTKRTPASHVPKRRDVLSLTAVTEETATSSQIMAELAAQSQGPTISSQPMPTPLASKAAIQTKVHKELSFQPAPAAKKLPEAETAEESTAVDSQLKPKRIRFGSEDPVLPVVSQEPADAQDAESDDESAESEDEAPETVTQTVALDRATKQEQEAASRAAREAEAEGERRQKRAERQATEAEARRLKQAKLKKKEEKASRLDIDLKNLPDLLPEEFLEAAPAVRPPTPTLESRIVAAPVQKKNQHLKFLEAATKDPKDKKFGANKVRVLSQQNPLLPPKATGNGRSIREKWLEGGRKGKGAGRKGLNLGKMERKQEYRGFLRR